MEGKTLKPGALTEEDRLLADIAVRLGYVGRDLAEALLVQLEEARVRGQLLTLEQLLGRNGLVTAAGFEEMRREATRRKFIQDAIPAGLLPLVADAASRNLTLGRYELHEKLGEGGMAVVYRATDLELGREVAVKVLKEFSPTATASRRFEREALVGANLSHPNIVTLYDAGEDGGRKFLVLEMVPGMPLSHVLASRRRDLKSFLRLLEKVARAVDYAHSKGVVHRDVKPANVLVTESGEPKMADFGLAHLADSPTALTQTGATLGTPPYMAPEQVRGEAGAITARTDVYALGAILYEMLAGRPPHVGETQGEIFVKVMTEDPTPPRKTDRRIARDLETICLKALEKKPGRRYASAEAFAEDLRKYSAGQPIFAAPPSPLRRGWGWVRRHPVAAAVATLVAAVATGCLAHATGVRLEAQSLARQAAEAERNGQWEAAADLLGQLRKLSPGGETAALAASFRERAEAAARKRAADRHRAGARAARQDFERLRREIETLRSTPASAPTTPAEQDAAWAFRRETHRIALALDDRRAAMLAAYTKAVGTDPSDDEAKQFLAEFYLNEYLAAERDGHTARTVELLHYIRMYDANGKAAKKLDAPGGLTVDSVPGGAEVYAFRFEEARDGRLRPRPFRVAAGAVDPEGPTDEGLRCSEDNRLGRCPVERRSVPRGSYLLLLRKKGYADVRLPVFVDRGREREARVRLYTGEEIGAGFEYVPAGPFVEGGDVFAYQAADRAEATTGDFFIARREVTYREYLEFLQDLARSDRPDEVETRLPRQRDGTTAWRFDRGLLEVVPPARPSLDLPVNCVSAHDADAYCAWRTRQARDRGDSVVVRLPTSREWEKAARGADGRAFPWGGWPDWSFANASGDRPRTGPVAGGMFPKDESPYGVQDLAGNLREWCSDWENESRGRRYHRGGWWGTDLERNFRAAARGWLIALTRDVTIGFRVVRVPDPQ